MAFPPVPSHAHARHYLCIPAHTRLVASRKGLASAQELLFAGCSAGALTTYVHTEYVRTRVPPTTRMVALADAMFSLHHDGYPANPNNYYTGQFTWGYTAWNSSRSMTDVRAGLHA